MREGGVVSRKERSRELERSQGKKEVSKRGVRGVRGE